MAPRASNSGRASNSNRNSQGQARQPPQHKFDPAEQFRNEITARTAAGETCEQIASALRAQGVDITNKTISRRRVEWGLRKRPYSKLLGKKAAVPRPKKATGTKTAGISLRKAEIEARTQAGQSADEIAAALEAQGYALKKGASTILRLQTQWGFIAPDPDRARGRKRKSEVQNDENGEVVKKVRKKDLPKLLREQEREANKVQQGQAGTLHYPSNCSFGPKKRVAGAMVDGLNDGIGEADDSAILVDDGDEGVMPGLDAVGPFASPLDTLPPAPQHPSVSVAAEIMSVEFLVDLATSTLGAANHLKEMLLAYQARTPVQGSLTGLPPGVEDLATARRKVREAAAVMHDLAVEPGEK